MVLELVSPNELGRALGIEAGARPLPVTARSRTVSEIRAPAWRDVGWAGLVLALFAIVCGAVIKLAETNPSRVDWLPYAFALGGVALLVFAWRRFARHSAYRDPGLTVEVTHDGVTVTGPEGSDHRAFADVNVLRILTRTPRNSVYFDGIAMDTSFGSIELGDGGFVNGNAAAGAVLKRLDELELAPARAA